MSMTASDIGTIPVSGFNWYVLYLEDAFSDPISEELSSNFITLGREVGRDILVVRGFDPNSFYASAYETLRKSGVFRVRSLPLALLPRGHNAAYCRRMKAEVVGYLPL